MRVKVSLEGCTKENKQYLEEFLQGYRGVFQEPKGIPPKREMKQKIQLLTLPIIGLYIYFVLEANEVKKKLQ
jgi:hypothetical protein